MDMPVCIGSDHVCWSLLLLILTISIRHPDISASATVSDVRESLAAVVV